MAENTANEAKSGRKSTGRNQTNGSRRPTNSFLVDFKGDSIVQEVMFGNTDILNKAYRGHFDGFSGAVFFLRRNLGILNNPELRDRTLSELARHLSEKQNELNAKKEIAQKLIQDNKLRIKTSSVGDLRQVKVIDPLAFRFLELIKLADEVGRLFSQLWVAMIIKDNEKSTAINEIVRLISGIHIFFRQAGNKARALIDARNSTGQGDSNSTSVEGESEDSIDSNEINGIEENQLVDDPDNEANPLGGVIDNELQNEDFELGDFGLDESVVKDKKGAKA